MVRILIKNAIARKPGHLYYLDRWGNIVEHSVGIRKLSIFEKLKCKWIDFERWLNDD